MREEESTAPLAAAAPRATPATPRLVLDVGTAVVRYLALASALPGTAVHYAVKANPHPVLLGTIFMTGGCFAPPLTAATAGSGAGASSTGSGEGVRAPLNGTVSRILVEDGRAIQAGAVVVVLEAMKMETEITAPQAGVVGSVLVAPGDAVTGIQLLLELS